MIKLNLSDITKINPMPIKSLKLYFGECNTETYREVEFSGENLVSESNIINEPVTRKNMAGGEQIIYWKPTITAYYITSDESAHIWLSTAARLETIPAVIEFGDTGRYEREQYARMEFGGNNALALSFRRETTQGFYRYVIKLTGFIKQLPTLHTN